MTTELVLDAIRMERDRQRAKWGVRDWPDGTGAEADAVTLLQARDDYRRAFEGRGSFRAILAEEVAEAFAESDPERLVEELVQVAAVACQWVEMIWRRRC